MKLPHFLDDIISLVFPRLCLACGEILPHSEPFVCLECQATLPQTHYHLIDKNPLWQRIDGSLKLEAAAALYYFTSGSRVQKLIHALKYHDHREVGIDIGRMYGNMLLQSPIFSTVDAIVPIPMHPQKLRLRGYNQSERFAKGLSESMQIPVLDGLLIKTQMIESQTKKRRVDRWQNIEGIYQWNNTRRGGPMCPPLHLPNPHLLLVDDVITTGATMQSCFDAIAGAMPHVRISVAAIAVVKS
jgi:predicted amidophosphoribosyltransferase